MGDALQASFEYALDLFDGSSIELLVTAMLRVLTAVADDPRQRLRDLPLLDEPQRQALLARGQPARGAGCARSLHELFSQRARQAPDAVALVCGAEQVTYAVLAGRAARLAGHLRRSGITTESVVGVCLERSISMVESIVAVVEAGGAYLPLDPAYPPERIGYMVRDSGARMVVSRSDLRAPCGMVAVPIVEIDTLDATIDPHADAADERAGAGNLA